MHEKNIVVAGRPKLVAVMTKHVDDLNMAGVRGELVFILQQLEKVFGKLNIEWNNFTNCGVRHLQNKVTTFISLDQIEYASALRTIFHAELTIKKADDVVCAELHSL